MENKLKQKRGVSKIITLAMVLLLPGFLSIVLNKFGSNSYVTLPIFGEKYLSGEVVKKMGKEYPDTVYHSLTPISFVDMHNEKVTMLDNDTSIYIVNLFFTRDSAFSQHNMEQLKTVTDRFAYNHIVQIFSISVDPNDSALELSAFMKPYNPISNPNWYIVSQPSRNIFEYSQRELLIDAMINPMDSNSFIIDNRYLLLDSKHRIRGMYEGDQHTEIKRLEDEVKLLLVEEVRNRPKKIDKKENAEVN